MAQNDPQAIAANWAARLGQSTSKITAGVNAVSVAPGVAAARQADVWVNNTTAAKGKWQRRVQAVSLQDWQAAMNGKGVQRIGPGATAAEGKFAAFMSQLLPHISAGQAKLQPRGTFDQNVARMVAWSNHMHSFKMSGS